MRIETKRLILREWQDRDIDAIIDGLSNVNVAKNLTVPYPYTIKNAKEFLENCNSSPLKLYLAICLKENGQVIGGTNIYVDKETSQGRGGIWINEKFAGKGYGLETWTARAKFAFEEMGLTELRNGFYDFNEKSKKMQLKIGYKIIGEKTNFSPALNKEVKEIVTLLKKEDFYKTVKEIK